jgi:hypothetical protein
LPKDNQVNGNFVSFKMEECRLVGLCTKGQLISRGLFGVIVLTKNQRRISALASKKSFNQKTLLYNYFK